MLVRQLLLIKQMLIHLLPLFLARLNLTLAGSPDPLAELTRLTRSAAFHPSNTTNLNCPDSGALPSLCRTNLVGPHGAWSSFRPEALGVTSELPSRPSESSHLY